MATIAELLVKISAKDQELKKGLTSASNRVGKFAKNAGKKLAVIGTIVAAAVAAATVKMIASFNETADRIDALAKTAEKLAIPIQELQKLQFQAKLTGVQANTLNMALQRMVRRISEAAMGSGEAKDALKELGLDAQRIAQLRPDEQFQLIARAFQDIGNQGDKVRLAMRLFDSEGVALVNTLNSNLEQTGKEFDALGGAITSQQAKAVEAFNDARTRLGVLFDGIRMQATAALAPALQAMVENIQKMIQEWGGVEVVAQRIAEAVKKMSSVVVEAARIMTNAFKGLQNFAEGVFRTLEKVEKFVKAPTEALKQRAQEFREGGTGIGLPGLTPSATLGTLSPKAAAARTQRQVQEINVIVQPDKEAFIRTVLTNEQLRDKINADFQAFTKDAARSTRR